jgi:hypothetical protein
MRDFEKSNISTTCEYVLCFEEALGEVIDSKRLCEEDYNIIVRTSAEHLAQTGNNRKVRAIWAAEEDLGNIINKMTNCSSISVEEAPQLSKNTIVIGNDREYIENIGEIEREFRAHFKSEIAHHKINIAFLKGDNLPNLL